jgi:NagD protein
MYTDILGGVQMGYRTVLVLSGHTSRQECQSFAYQPDLVVPCANAIPEEWIIGSTGETLIAS